MAVSSTVGELNVRITADTSSATSGLQNVQQGLDRTSASSRNLQRTAEATNTRMANLGRNAGMAGIQIQQFVGQVTTGTAATVALSQQAADLGFVLGFPLLGAVTGIAAALAGPLMSALTDTTGGMKELQDAAEAINAGLDESARLTAEFANTQHAEGLRALNSEVNRTNTALQNQRAILDNLITQRGEAAEGGMFTSDAETQQEVAALNRQIERQRQLVGQMGFAYDQAAERRDAFVEGARGGGTNRFTEALRAQTSILQNELTLRQQIEEGAISEQQAREVLRHQQRTMAVEARFQEEMQKLAEREEQQAELQLQYDTQKEAAAALHADNMIRIKQEQADQELRIRQLAQNAEIGAMTSFASGALSVMQAFGKKSFEVQKMFAIADSIVNIAGGVAKALNHPYPANLGFAAQVAAQGAALISTIRSTNPNSNSSGASTSSAGGSAPAVSAPEPSRSINIMLSGNSMFSTDQVRNLIEQINENVRDGMQLNAGVA